MVRLNIKIYSTYYSNEWERHYKEYSITKDYKDNVVFRDVLIELHNKYKIDNGSIDNFFVPHITELLWSTYFEPEFCYKIIDSYDDYLNLKLIDLEKQFSISKLIIPLFLNYDGIGKAIGDVDGVKLFFHFNERDLHHKPHVHCGYSGHETRIEIDSLKVLDKPFKKVKMDKAIEFIKKNQVALRNYWDNAIINGQPIELIVEL